MAEIFQVRKSWHEKLFANRPLISVIMSVLLLGSFVALVGAYQWTLGPRDRNDSEEVRVVVASGDGVSSIGSKLKRLDLIKSEMSFRIYAELSNTKSRLQAGGYALSRSMSVPDIISHMTTGKTDEFNVRVAPGLTLKQQYDPSLDGSFAHQGFTADEITEALNATYESRIFDARPAGATLEGYIHPDTYRMAANGSLNVIIQKSFDELERLVAENDIEKRLSDRGLTLHEGITLASIIQKEVTDPADQPQVAQVFLKRLADEMPLQSDPTFIYAARQLNQTASVNIDSPYNTYKNRGLPPGPIANFNFTAIMAVVEPAAGDYLYFVADDQLNTYFSRTLEEHEAKVERYCTAHCNDF